MSLVQSMALVALIGADLAALRAGGKTLPNPGLALMVVALELMLIRAIAHREKIRAEWIGFQVAGWAYVLVHWAFARSIWRWSGRFYLWAILDSPVFNTPRERWDYLLFTSCVHLVFATSFAFVGAVVARRVGGETRAGAALGPSWKGPGSRGNAELPR